MNLLKNPSAEFVSNSSSFRPQSSKNSRLNTLVKKFNHDHGFGSLEASSSASNFSPTVAHQQQQIYSNALGVRPVTDRMSKEKQKFFRFSVFNSERKSKLVKSTKQKLLSINNNNNNNISNLKSSTNNLAITNTSTQPLVGHDKYKFESSSDSENERVNDCDIASKTINNVKKAKEKITNIAKTKKASQQTLKKDCTQRQSNNQVKPKQKVKKNHSLTSEDDSVSSYCTSDDENDSASSSDTSSDSSSDSESSSSEASSSGSCKSSSSSANKKIRTPKTPSTSLLNKTEAINTMNVFACINSRELANQTGNAYCWSSMPFSASQNDSSSLFKSHPSSFNNPFGLTTRTESDNAWGFAAEAKKAVNIFNSNSDNEKSRKIKRNKKQSSSALNDSSSILAMTNKLSKHKLANEYFAKNRRTTTLMRNNIIMSSDDDAKQLSPSKMFRKAVNYKKFDNHKLNNKKLIMDPNASDGADNPVKVDSNSKNELSQSPYHNSKNNHLELGKKLSSFSTFGRKFIS